MAFMILMVLFFALALFVLHIAVCVWTYRDAMRHGRSQEFALIMLALVFLFPVMGVIVYLLIRES